MRGPRIHRLAWLAAFAALLAAAPAQAQRALLKSDKGVLAAFRPVVAKPSRSTVRVVCDGKEVALGTIVAADGWIVTKASEVKGKVVVQLKDGKTFPATVVGVEEKFDLAMLKVQAKNLEPVEWAPSKSAEVGDWLAAVGTGDEPAALGVVSVAAREPKLFEMPPPAPKNDSGYMGVQLDGDEGPPKIAKVEPKEAAEKAGLRAGDVVLSVQGNPVNSVERLIATIQKFKAGSIVTLKIKRGEKEQELKVTLGKRPAGQLSRGDMQNSMGSKLSDRRGGFPAIMQSDLVIKNTDCGGPAVTLGGKAVGVVIARAGRTESYVIPSENVEGLIAALKSGRLRPKEEAPVVNVKDLEEAVSKAEAALRAKQKALRNAEDDDAPDKKKIEALTAEVKALRKKLSDAEKALAEARRDVTKEKGEK